MVEQAAKPLARPIKVWVLDATPGKVRAGKDGEDHPGELIAFLSKMPKQVSSNQEVMSALVQEGFSTDVAWWVVTNLRAVSHTGSRLSVGFSWVFDLKGIAEMYKSYEETSLWKIVENVPRGVHVNFLKAERSLHRWALEDLQRIHAAEALAADEGAGVEMHVLEDAGHWVHYYVQSHIQINEYRDRVVLPAAKKKYGRCIGTCVKVLDMTGLKLAALSQIKDCLLQLLTLISTVDDLNYPEKTDTYYIVNAPYIFSACWKVVKPLLQERTRRKVQVL